MTTHIRYLTHPQVKIDPAVPVPSWGFETAEIIARELNVTVEVREAMHENDRSATGFLPPYEFETVANRFFADPLVSIRGWERAIDAQLRIVREV